MQVPAIPSENSTPAGEDSAWLGTAVSRTGKRKKEVTHVPGGLGGTGEGRGEEHAGRRGRTLGASGLVRRRNQGSFLLVLGALVSQAGILKSDEAP